MLFVLWKYYPILRRIALESRGDPDLAEKKVLAVFACRINKKISKKALIKAARELTLIIDDYRY